MPRRNSQSTAPTLPPSSSPRAVIACSLAALVLAVSAGPSCTLDTTGRGEGSGIQSICGDRWIQHEEDCESSSPIEVDCSFFGFQEGEVSCSSKCQYDTTDCSTCGDGAVDGREQCDGDNLDAATCATAIGLPGGVLACTPQCRFDTSGCNSCGNFALEGEEQCDGLVPSTVTCATLTVHAEGKVNCSKACTYDTSGCHTCGDGAPEGPEACDGTDFKGETCTSIGEGAGSLTCSSDCRLDVGGCFQPPADWLDPAWLYRRRITTDPALVDAPLLHFPMLVVVTDPSMGAKAQPAGEDFVFTAMDGKTRLPHEIESWDPTAGTLVAWVRVDLPSTVPLKLRLFYGNPNATDQQAPSAVWDQDFAAVYHLNEDTQAGGTTKSHRDSTGTGHDGSQSGNAAGQGLIAGAQIFDGIDDFVELANSDQIALGNAGCTVSAWILTSSAISMGIVTKADPSTYDVADKVLGMNATYGVFGVDHGGISYLASIDPIIDSAWHHVAWTQKSNASGQLEQWDLYVDGVFQASKLVDTRTDVQGRLIRLAQGVGPSVFDWPFAGAIDEVRISTVARTPAWLAASVANQRDPATFASVGIEQELGPGL